MMPIRTFNILVLFLFMISCNSEYKFMLHSPTKIQLDTELKISLSEKSNKPYDSVQFFIDQQKIIGNGSTGTIHLNDIKLGKHNLIALVFYQKKTQKITKPVYITADSAPDIYTYEIVNSFPHDKNAYTQGLEYYNGFLYEGTGRNGFSSIRKVELETGKVLQQVDLDSAYFGEGITIFNNKLFQLTWKGGIGFVYHLETFEKEKDFKYTKSREGWGLTHTDEFLIKTDGSERIWFLNPDTLKEESYIEAYTNKRKVEKLNELEFVNGLIYANIWQQNSILIVDPSSGKVTGVANLNSLKEKISQEQKLDDTDEVLNGIAFDKENNRLFVTGKHWSKLYEIKLIKK